MAAAVLSYSAERFNALPSLGVASVAFAPRKTAVLPELIALISRAGLADVAGVALLHAHFSMHDDERLVQRGEVRPARTARVRQLVVCAAATPRSGAPPRVRAPRQTHARGLGPAPLAYALQAEA